MDEETSFTKTALDAAKLGASLAVANEANVLIKEGARKALVAAGVDQKALENPVFEKGVPMLSALTILFVADRFPDLIPKSDLVVKAASLALSQATAESIQPMLALAAPTLAALAGQGAKLAQLEGDTVDPKEAQDQGYDDAEFFEVKDDDDGIEVTPSERPQVPTIDVDAQRRR
jgi:hypothetical protein